ncbi:MAG: NUDIX hydrolase [Anaerolineae bacterium]|nr:NUDIX hydrolase [Anaerolineae bacterium]
MIVDDSWYQKPVGVQERTSSGGIVIRWDGKPYIILVRENGFSHYWLPKGGVEKGESLEEAARREIAEEAGIFDLTLICPLGSYARLNFQKNRWITTHYFLFTTTQTGALPSDSHHDYISAWFALDALPPMLWREQETLIRENTERIWKLFSHLL